MSEKLQIKNKIEEEKSIKIAPFKKGIRNTTPHKHNNYFEIIYLSDSSGYHYIDSRKYEVKPPVIFFIRKEQVHYWELEKESSGYVIIIKKSFIDKSLDSELKSLVTKISSQSSLYVKDNTVIDNLFSLLTTESDIQSEHSFHIIEGLLKALLGKILEVSKPVINKKEIKSGLYQSFLALLHTGQAVKNTVHYYAEKLNTSPQNLNASCRKAIEQSATEVLQEFLISEAKRLLHYTQNTVTEIAFLLDFKDASHFVKYFKRVTGQTPQVFRRLSE
jgi:AraC family transcriptional activator of pobA